MDGHAARVTGTGENSRNGLEIRANNAEKNPTKPNGFMGLRGRKKVRKGSVVVSEISSGQTCDALPQSAAIDGKPRDVLAGIVPDGVLDNPCEG